MGEVDIKDTLNNLTEKSNEIRAYIVAYERCLDSFRSVLESYFKESKRLEIELEKGYTGVNLHKLIELSAKIKLMRENICFMQKTLDDAKRGVF